MSKNKTLNTIFIVDSIGEHRGLHYHNFPLASELCNLGLRVFILSTPETCVHELLPKNIKTKTIGIFKGIYGDKSKIVRGINYLLSLIKLIYWAFKEKPQIIHFHFYQVPIMDLLAILFLKNFHFSIVTSVHDILPLQRRYEVNRFSASIFRLIYKLSDGLNVHSNYVYKIILRSFQNLKDKVFMTNLGNYIIFQEAMENKFRLSQSEAKICIGLNETDQIILIFGTIKPNKRLDWVINSFKFVVDRNKYARLIIVGSLQDRDVIKELQLTNELGLENNIIFRIGKLSDEELFYYLKSADIVIFPYEYIYQSAGIIMAMTFGKPIITTYVGSNRELIQSGKTGLFSNMVEPMELAASIDYLLTNRDEAQNLGRMAYKYIKQKHSWKSLAKKTLENYQMILLADC